MINLQNVKIVLLNVEAHSAKVTREFSPPFGMLIAASVLKEKNIDVVVKHIIEDENFEQTLLSVCIGASMVGFSTMTTSNLISTIKGSKILKAANHFIFWGGVHATLLPETSLKEKSVDAVLRGEAETNLFKFVQWRLGLISEKYVPGLCFKNATGDVCISSIPPPVKETKLSYHSFDFLDINLYLNREEYTLNCSRTTVKNVLPFMTSKGCYKRCTFCYNNIINKSIWRAYNLDHVFKEMDWLIENYNIEGWYFYDDNFFGNMERAWHILKRYKMPSFVEVDLSKIGKNFIENAIENRIERLYIGIESGSDRTLKRIRKGINVDMIKDRISMCNEYNLPVELSFMILYPNETQEELSLTFNLIQELDEFPNVKIDGPKIYNPYPGTELYNELLSSGWKRPQTNEQWAKYERNISPLETGFKLTEKHIEILEKNELI